MADEQCRLLKLPPELRNRIYELALSDHDRRIAVNLDKHSRGVPPLLQVCRQTRREALSMYYGGATFGCYWLHETSRVEMACQWFELIGDEAAKHVRHIRVCAGTWNPFNYCYDGLIFDIDTSNGAAEAVVEVADCRGKWDRGAMQRLQTALRSLLQDVRGDSTGGKSVDAWVKTMRGYHTVAKSFAGRF